MTTIAFPLPLTPAASLLQVCEHLPERFRLADPLVAFERGAHGASRPLTLSHLEVDTGPGWTQGGVYLQEGTPDIHEEELTGMAFSAVVSYCFDERLPFMLTHAPQASVQCRFLVAIGPEDHKRLHLGSTPTQAALLALAAHLRSPTRTG